MTDINKLEVHWEKVSWDVTTRLGTDMSKIVKWGDLTYLHTREYPKVVVEFTEKECKIQIYDIKIYPGTEFPTAEMKKSIAMSLMENDEKYGDKFKYLFLDAEYKLFAGRADYNTEWVFLGMESDKWKPLNFASYCTWFEEYGKELKGNDLYWRIGNQLFRTSALYSERVFGAIVLVDYCDRFIPKKDGEVKPVSFWGFATLLMFLRNISGDKRLITTSQLRSLYVDFEKADFIPVIPIKWKTDDIELMNMKRLDLVLADIEEKTLDKKKKEEEDEKKKEEENKAKNSQGIWEKDSEKDSETDSVETHSGEKSTISEMLINAKNLIKNQIELTKEEKGSGYSVLKNKPLTLSKILSGQLLLNSGIWSGEYLVDIDTNITEGGVSISEDEMSVAIISYGLLEILVDDKVQQKLCDELEELIEEKYGIATVFIGISDASAKSVLEKGEKINAES